MQAPGPNEPRRIVNIPNTRPIFQKLDHRSAAAKRTIKAVAKSLTDLKESIKRQYLESEGQIIGNILNGNVYEDTERQKLIDKKLAEDDKFKDSPEYQALLREDDLIRRLNSTSVTDIQARKLIIFDIMKRRNYEVLKLLSEKKKEDLAESMAEAEAKLAEAGSSSDDTLSDIDDDDDEAPRLRPRSKSAIDKYSGSKYVGGKTIIPPATIRGLEKLNKKVVDDPDQDEIKEAVRDAVDANPNDVADTLVEAGSDVIDRAAKIPFPDNDDIDEPTEPAPPGTPPRPSSPPQSSPSLDSPSSQSIKIRPVSSYADRMKKLENDIVKAKGKGKTPTKALSDMENVRKARLYSAIKRNELYEIPPRDLKADANQDKDSRLKKLKTDGDITEAEYSKTLAYLDFRQTIEQYAANDGKPRGTPLQMAKLARSFVEESVDLDANDYVRERHNKWPAKIPASNANEAFYDYFEIYYHVKRAGSGLKRGRGIRYYKSPSELQHRLKILLGEMSAGNTNKALVNEVANIADILLKDNVISRPSYNKLYSLIK